MPFTFHGLSFHLPELVVIWYQNIGSIKHAYLLNKIKGDTMRHHTYGYIYGILAAFFYALVAIVAKPLVMGGTHPFQVTFYQYLFTILILGIWISVRNRSAFRCDLKKDRCFCIAGYCRRRSNKYALLFSASIS